MAEKKLFLWLLTALMAVTFAACSDKDEPDGPDSVSYTIETTTSYKDNNAVIDLSRYVDSNDISGFRYDVTESGTFTMVDGKPVASGAASAERWIDDVTLDGDHMVISFTPSVGENRYAVIDVTFNKKDGSQVVVKATVYQEGKKGDEPGPSAEDLSYSLRLSIVSSDGKDLLNPLTPYNLVGSGISWVLNNSYPPSGTKAENPATDEATGMRYVTIRGNVDDSTVNRSDTYVVYWAEGVNSASIVVSEADGEGLRTYSLNGAEPQPLEDGRLITLTTPSGDDFRYKPLNVIMQCADIKGNLTDAFYITATDDDNNEYEPSATPGAPAYDWKEDIAGIWFTGPLCLTEDAVDAAFTGVRIPSALYNLVGNEVEFNANNLFVLGNFDQTEDMDKSYLISLLDKEDGYRKAVYRIRVVNEVTQIANFKVKHFRLYLDGKDVTRDYLNTGVLTLMEQPLSALN